MRIAFLNKNQNKVLRGSETFVYELSRRLSKNHEVDVISDINYLALLRKKYDVIIPTNGRFQVIVIRKIAWLIGAKMIVSGQSGIGWDDKVNLLSFPNVLIFSTISFGVFSAPVTKSLIDFNCSLLATCKRPFKKEGAAQKTDTFHL